MDELQNNHPNIDLSDASLRCDFNNYQKYEREKERIIENMQACKSDDPDSMCEDCNCWKMTREMCS